MRVLVIRRDNIGDLVCTTPLFAALRRRYPQAWIGALVNSYNAPVLNGNPDLDEVVAYTKLKHLEEGQSSVRAIASRLRSFWRLRRNGLDYVVLASSDFSPKMFRLARWLGARRVAAFSDGSSAADALDLAIPAGQIQGKHEVERVFALARLFGIEGDIPPLKVVADPAQVAKARAAYDPAGKIKVAVHISARRPRQRWPAERFAELVERLRDAYGASVMLLWSPGAADHPRHPGDDDKVRQIVDRLSGNAGITAYPTAKLEELIGALAACDALICSDGGALHLGAALSKPIACFFGDSPVERWHPWGVPHRILHPASNQVSDVTVEDAVAAIASLFAQVIGKTLLE